MADLFNFEKLLMWQKSVDFADAIVDITENLATPNKHFKLIEQAEGASVSIAQNIAEGCGRGSTKEYLYFLRVARGSLYETMTLVAIFKQRQWINEEMYINLRSVAEEIAKMLNASIRSLNAKVNEPTSSTNP